MTYITETFERIRLEGYDSVEDMMDFLVSEKNEIVVKDKTKWNSILENLIGLSSEVLRKKITSYVSNVVDSEVVVTSFNVEKASVAGSVLTVSFQVDYETLTPEEDAEYPQYIDVRIAFPIVDSELISSAKKASKKVRFESVLTEGNDLSVKIQKDRQGYRLFPEKGGSLSKEFLGNLRSDKNYREFPNEKEAEEFIKDFEKSHKVSVRRVY